MTQQTKAELIRHHRREYRRAGKKQKTQIILSLMSLTGYSRKHLIHALNQDVEVPKKITRQRVSRYGIITEPLEKLWAVSNLLCGKRLKPFIPELVKSLKRHKEISLSKENENLLLAVSASTIDRLLAPARREIRLKGRSTTKPGTLLRHQIPIRTFADWDDARPGFLEVDLVAHCGDRTAGEYINTLNMTDISTGWTVATAFMGRSDRFCAAAIDEVKGSLPFQILGIDSDNGGEFINNHFKRYCERNQITFTRSRPWRKNDSCHVEQKNWDIIRKMIGYGRFGTYEQLDVLKRIYNLLALYQNYFQPSRKLIAKTRIGARVTKKYDAAQTPAQRLLARSDTPKEVKRRLRDTFRGLNPAQLQRTINQLLVDLYEV